MRLQTNMVHKQIQKLKLVLSPKLIHMLKVFNQSYADHMETIQKEADDNVFLDVIKYDQLADFTKKSSSLSTDNNVNDYLEQQSNYDSLYDVLLKQLDLEFLSPKEHEIAELLIENIDDRGYLENYTEIQEMIEKKLNVSPRKIFDVLKIIQSFEPEGVGARNLKECLLIQIESSQFNDSPLQKILTETVNKYLDEVSKNNIKKLASIFDLNEDGAKALVSYIKNNLNPNPGSAFTNDNNTNHVIPSFEVVINENGKIALTNLEEKYGIKIALSPKYETYLADKSLDEATRNFLEEKLKKAKELIDNIEKRKENLDRLALIICEKQHNFISHGEAFLLPLLQKNVAEKLDISSSTVSRIVSSKYIQTPHGIYSLKQLCPRDHFGKTAERLKLMIKEIAEMNPTWSDQKITNYLNDDGMAIARRTVTKYRLLTDVTSSMARKKDNAGPNAL